MRHRRRTRADGSIPLVCQLPASSNIDNIGIMRSRISYTASREGRNIYVFILRRWPTRKWCRLILINCFAELPCTSLSTAIRAAVELFVWYAADLFIRRRRWITGEHCWSISTLLKPERSACWRCSVCMVFKRGCGAFGQWGPARLRRYRQRVYRQHFGLLRTSREAWRAAACVCPVAGASRPLRARATSFH